MNSVPGEANPHNPLVPFAQFDKLHFARFVIMDDQTLNDWEVYGLPKPTFPVYLAFLCDFDGDHDGFMQEICKRAGIGLQQIFSHCSDFGPDDNLLRWFRQHDYRPSTYYFSCPGRTMRQVREDEALRSALVNYLQTNGELSGYPAIAILEKLRKFVNGEKAAGRIHLTSEAAASLSWRITNLVHLLFVPLLLLLALPLLTIYAPLFFLQLRWRENRDPVIAPRPDPDYVSRLAVIEDHGVTNQFSAMGGLKPGLFRRWTSIFVLWIVNYGARNVFVHGRLARVLSIHCASWTFIDGRKRLFFASNYDGSLENYMDDFVNKVAFGLNVTFSNGMGYPKTDWLLLNGAKDEQAFKYFIRRHQLPTEVWYNGHACLTNANLERNGRIRKGIEGGSMTEEEARAWVGLL